MEEQLMAIEPTCLLWPTSASGPTAPLLLFLQGDKQPNLYLTWLLGLNNRDTPHNAGFLRAFSKHSLGYDC